MKRLLFLVVAAMLVLTACGGKDEVKEVKDEADVIKIDDELAFHQFVVTMNEIKVYEEDGKDYADISFRWLNNTGDKAKFMSITGFYVKQNEQELDEPENSWADPTSDVHFSNAEKGETKIKLTYELENKEDPIEITFSPRNPENENEESKSIQIDIN